MTGNPVGLVEFLLARLDELEGQAKEAQQHGDAEFNLAQQTAYQAALRAPDNQWHREQAARHIGSWHPVFVLQDIAAKRRIIELHHPDPAKADTWYWLQRECAECKGGWHKWLPDKLPTDIGPEQGCRTLRLLAAPFSSHPDWQPEWSVE